MNLTLLLDSSTATTSKFPSWLVWVILIVLFAVMFIPSMIRNKKEKKAYEEKIAGMTVGAKVKTIGLISGTIVSINEEDVVIKTGSEESPSFITVDKRAIYEITGSDTELPKGDDGVFTDDSAADGSSEAPADEEAPVTEENSSADSAEKATTAEADAESSEADSSEKEEN